MIHKLISPLSYLSNSFKNGAIYSKFLKSLNNVKSKIVRKKNLLTENFQSNSNEGSDENNFFQNVGYLILFFLYLILLPFAAALQLFVNVILYLTEKDPYERELLAQGLTLKDLFIVLYSILIIIIVFEQSPIDHYFKILNNKKNNLFYKILTFFGLIFGIIMRIILAPFIVLGAAMKSYNKDVKNNFYYTDISKAEILYYNLFVNKNTAIFLGMILEYLFAERMLYLEAYLFNKGWFGNTSNKPDEDTNVSKCNNYYKKKNICSKSDKRKRMGILHPDKNLDKSNEERKVLEDEFNFMNDCYNEIGEIKEKVDNRTMCN